MLPLSQWKQGKKWGFHVSALLHLMREPFSRDSLQSVNKIRFAGGLQLAFVSISWTVRGWREKLVILWFLQVSLHKLLAGRIEFCIMTQTCVKKISVNRKEKFPSDTVLSLHFYVLPLQLPLVSANNLNTEGKFCMFLDRRSLVLKVDVDLRIKQRLRRPVRSEGWVLQLSTAILCDPTGSSQMRLDSVLVLLHFQLCCLNSQMPSCTCGWPALSWNYQPMMDGTRGITSIYQHLKWTGAAEPQIAVVSFSP